MGLVCSIPSFNSASRAQNANFFFRASQTGRVVENENNLDAVQLNRLRNVQSFSLLFMPHPEFAHLPSLFCIPFVQKQAGDEGRFFSKEELELERRAREREAEEYAKGVKQSRKIIVDQEYAQLFEV